MRTVIRHHLIVVGCIAALLGSTVAYAAPPATAQVDATTGRFIDKISTDVDVTRDVIYRRTTTHNGWPIDLRLNIYEPRGDTRADRPVVMWMFGGMFAYGDRNQLEAYAIDSAQRGYVGVTIDYRVRWELLLLGFSDLTYLVDAATDAYHDAVAAVEWLKANAGEHRLDPDAIVAGGVSAGAVLAMNLLYVKDQGPETSPVAGAVSISGYGFTRAAPGDPPAIMHHGTLDSLAPYETGKQTCDDAIAAGAVCDWVPHEGGDHDIALWNFPEIVERSAGFIFDQVLVPQGYSHEG